MSDRWWKFGTARIDLDEVVAVGAVINHLPGPGLILTVTFRGGHDVKIGTDQDGAQDFLVHRIFPPIELIVGPTPTNLPGPGEELPP